MSIEYLHELKRSVDGGNDLYACTDATNDHWQIARSLEESLRTARRAAAKRRVSVSIFRLVPPRETDSGALFLVPVAIYPPGPQGEPQIRWATIGTLEAALVMRHIRHGPTPVFGIQFQESVWPE